MGQSLLPPLESTSEIRVLYMYICQKGLYYWKRKWKEFTEEVVPINFTFPNFAQITDKYNFLCFVF